MIERADGMNAGETELAGLQLQIRPGVPEDCAILVRVESACFSQPWSVAQLAGELNQGGVIAALGLLGGRETGFVLGRIVADECEILRIAVMPEFRNRGIGLRLLSWFLDTVASRGATTVWLEVRPTNSAAVALYHRAGFRECFVRKNYYGPDQHALVLLRRL
jgi:ribosomal-protein-alanine N-acetyltransferase